MSMPHGVDIFLRRNFLLIVNPAGLLYHPVLITRIKVGRYLLRLENTRPRISFLNLREYSAFSAGLFLDAYRLLIFNLSRHHERAVFLLIILYVI
ncbi:hypothetical protein D3C80_86110 [compost metagenome]